MKYFGAGLSESHKELNRIIRKPELIEQTKELFLEIHGKLHLSVVSGNERNEVDELVGDLREDEYAIMPTAKDETIAWVLWHISRIEDLTMNILVNGEKHVSDLDSIPQNVLKLSDDYATPLYAMPWDLKLINVTKEIIDLIVSDKNIQKKREIFIERLLFSEGDTADSLQDYAILHSIPVKSLHFIFSLTVTQTILSEGNAAVSETMSILKSIGELNGNRFPIIMIPSGDTIIGFCSVDSDIQVTHAVDYITAIYKLLITKYTPRHYALAFGSPYLSLADMSLSYKESKQALYFIKKTNPENHIARFDTLTLYRLFFDINDFIPKSASLFVDKNLKTLMDYDEKNGSELITTLKFFLQHNCNLIKTADALYIHRNTLIYRLNIIKRTLNDNLDSALTRMSLFLSILYHEFTQSSN